LEEEVVLYQRSENSSSDQYGIAPFDANKDLKKLSLWDSPPTEAEMEDIKPLLARIHALKSANGDALLGTWLMAFFFVAVNSASSTSCLQALVILWLGGFFSSV
jgi:hypothetical protein